MRHQLALLAMAPILGGAFVVFLPVIGFVIFGYVVVLKTAQALGFQMAKTAKA